MQSELEQLECDAAEMSAKRHQAERRRTELMDQIAALKAGKPAAPSSSGGRLYRATRQVLNVLDVSRARRVTLHPGMQVASSSVNAQRHSEAVFVSPETERVLVADGSIQ